MARSSGGLLLWSRKAWGRRRKRNTDGTTLEVRNDVDVLTADEVTHVLHERDRQLRAAEWSPSGLSRLGGCLLAVMTNTFQVSVYAPGDDTLNTGYEEVGNGVA